MATDIEIARAKTLLPIGEIARKIVAFSESNGGYYTTRDFEDHTSAWVEPVTTSYRGHDIWEIPPNSSGIVALMMLNILEGYDLAASGSGSATRDTKAAVRIASNMF